MSAGAHRKPPRRLPLAFLACLGIIGAALAIVLLIPPSTAPDATPPAPLPSHSVRPVTSHPVRPSRSPSDRYTVRLGDTLTSIAKSKCGNADDWPSIQQANGITPALNPGQVITIKC